MKKLFCVFLIFTLILSFFSSAAFATTEAWQASYFNKLIEIREKPGIIRSVLTDRDNNGFATETICYALNDYNEDGIPELIVYGTNIAGEAGDNYQIYTFNSGKLEKFDIIKREGQPFYPYYTDFFFLPDGYTDKETNELVWAMKTSPDSDEFWAIAGTPYENDAVFEVDFDFKSMTVDIIPVVFAEGTEHNEYSLKLQGWNETHELSVKHDEYGRKIPKSNEELWNRLSESADFQMPETELKNRILISFNKVIRSALFWIIAFMVFILALLPAVKAIVRKKAK